MDDLSACIQRFKISLTFIISPTPGKGLPINDTLSGASTLSASVADEQFCQDTEMFVESITTNFPATGQFLTETRSIPK